MARPLRIEFPGAVYHITSRGNGRERIFFEEKDRKTFLDVLSVVVRKGGWICHAYCLMGNHYHLLIETPLPNLSWGMRHLNGVYTQRFNCRHARPGHVFQGRFNAILIEKESHLLEVCRYIVLNPVRANLVNSAKDWKWSSHRAMGGLEEAPRFLTVEGILARFDGPKEPARLLYRKFIADGICHNNIRKKPPADGVLGSDPFRQWVSGLLKSRALSPEYPAAARRVGTLPLEVVLAQVTPDSRDAAILNAHVRYGYRQREIAEHLGLHYSTVSKILRRHEHDSPFKT